MTSFADIYFLFFALPGFLTVLLVRHIALYKRTLTQTEFVFYSLACSMPSYLTSIAVIGATDAETVFVDVLGAGALVILVQSIIAALYGTVIGYAIKFVARSHMRRHTPWYGFVLDAKGQYVIVHTTSSRRYYGWVRQGSSDDEPHREMVLGDPVRLGRGKNQTRIGSEMLFCEGEIARIVRVKFRGDGDAPAHDGRIP